MVIVRPGDTPHFYEYAKSYALVSNDRPSSKWPEAVKVNDPNPIKIPAYQRKIVWGTQEVKEFLDSKAVLFGTVIMAQGGNTNEDSNHLILLDGLQRFATSTALIKCLYPLVLSPTPSEQNHAEKFSALRNNIGNFQPVIEHNHDMLSNHTRTGIADSYDELFKKIEKLVNDNLKNKSDYFAKVISETFNKKQIAIDKYYGFKNTNELVQTFINMNSTGINLKEVDLLRSEIISKAEELKWDKAVIGSISEMENEFTATFTNVPNAEILGKNMYHAFEKEKPEKIFPYWKSLEKKHVNGLLEFMEDMYRASELYPDSRTSNPYLYEIFQCEKLPFTMIIWHFYHNYFLNDKIPDFIGGDVDTVADQRLLLRVFYRRLIDGSIGRISPIAREYIMKDDKWDANSLAERIHKGIPGGLDKTPNRDWLEHGLRRINPKYARRIFNACLLPDRSSTKNDFLPLVYGRKNNEWHIDHLIPKGEETNTRKDSDIINSLVNLAPLQAKLNRGTMDTSCNRKLNPDNGVYAEIRNKHPYIEWLCSDHYKIYRDKKMKNEYVLDMPNYLDSGPSIIAIGDSRINQIIKLLENKI